jgi:signal transduction histidine kinase
LFTYNATRDQFELGVRRGDIRTNPSLPDKNGVAYQIASTGLGIFADIASDQFPKEEFLKKNNVVSFAGVPLIIGENTVVGILYVNYHSSHDFSDEEKGYIQLLANQAAVAIDNANLYSELQNKITELEKAQNRLLTAERLMVMNEIAAEFVHRLGNLAGTIPVRVTLAKEKLDPEDTNDRAVIRYLDGINSDAKGLLEAAKNLERGAAFDTEMVTVDINHLITSVVSHIGIPNAIQVKENFNNNLPDVEIPKEQFSETIKNLVMNGIQAMPGGGTLMISTDIVKKFDAQYVQIVVSDTGNGIPKPDQEKIFELFYTTKPQGLGYGLWRDKNLIEALKGQISLVSSNDQGSKFEILLPVME